MVSDRQLLEGAEEFLAAAEAEADASRYRVAFESARHAAELAAKAILKCEVGRYPERHDVSSDLERAGLTPPAVKYKDLQKLLSEFTWGTYGFSRSMRKREVTQALRVARRVVEGARSHVVAA